MGDQGNRPKRKGNPNWVKGGPSPNPKGRPRSGLAFAERVRERVDPDMLIDKVLEVLEHATNAKDKLAAATFLRDSAWIKPPTTLAISHDLPDETPLLDVTNATDEQLEQLEKAAQAITQITSGGKVIDV